ncbi:TPA: hypothetical protein DIU22_05120 [Candidatus Woesebacteria bacterium]|nr:hypothetical protein [Candidatus Woesebacteria bacterium]
MTITQLKEKYFNVIDSTDFDKDFMTAVKEEYPNFSDKLIEKILEYCWSEGHSSGYYEVINCLLALTDILDFFKKK